MKYLYVVKVQIFRKVGKFMVIDENDKRILQDNLKLLRITSGLLVSDLGKLTNSTKQCVSNYETRKTEISDQNYVIFRSCFEYIGRINYNVGCLLRALYDKDVSDHDTNLIEKCRLIISANTRSNASLYQLINSILDEISYSTPEIDWTDKLFDDAGKMVSDIMEKDKFTTKERLHYREVFK